MNGIDFLPVSSIGVISKMHTHQALGLSHSCKTSLWTFPKVNLQ